MQGFKSAVEQMATSVNPLSNPSAASPSDSSEPPPLKFVVTCFGPFRNQPTNPTQVLGPALVCAQPNVNTVCVELPVAKAGVDAAMKDVWLEHVASFPSSSPVIVLHMGVDGTQREAGHFKLERRGVNQLDFRIPDNEGFQPRKVRAETPRLRDRSFLTTYTCLPPL